MAPVGPSGAASAARPPAPLILVALQALLQALLQAAWLAGAAQPAHLAHLVQLAQLAPPTAAQPAQPQPQHHGLFSGAVPGARLVFPRKVPDGGGGLEHHHGQHRRQRRGWPGPEAAAVCYDVPLAGAVPARLLLWPSTGFLAPALRVDRPARGSGSLSGSRARRQRRAPRLPTCHYRGVVHGDPGSSVAVSACGQGLVGFVRTSKADYWLEPAVPTPSSHNASSPSGWTHLQPHLVFRRRGGLGQGLREGLGQGLRQGLRQGLGQGLRQGLRQGLGPHRHGHGRGGRPRGRRRRMRHDKDCGTREPRARRGANRTLRAGGRRRAGGRGPRSVSRERHVEVLLVADASMTAFHQDGDVETYLLTIMNMVAAMYHDPTIGNPINVAVVRIILMDEWEPQGEGETFNATVNADRTLTSFCRWASQINPPDEADPHHHDVAVLVTRVDICARRDTPCNTLGVAHVGGMCSPDRACSVNQDNGIVLAHTIAHEMGHNFGMTHDTEASGCPRKVDNVLHVMTPTFEADNHRMAWSSCSRGSVTAFLDAGKGACLDDAPSLGGYQFPDLPAGSMYDAEHQCRLQFGVDEAAVCSDMEEVCSRLWCEVDGQCTTLLQPAAPGTVCGKHKWCQDQQCADMGELPAPVPGGWSAWGDWGPCSRSCGAGVAVMERRCDHPTPRHGGAYCLGERRRYRLCNTQPCPDGAPSFRAVQCAAFNNRTYRGGAHSWQPYLDPAEPCELHCADAEGTVIMPWTATVVDGTPCNAGRAGRRDMCIGRVCRKVGCDWMVDSDAAEDRCGVCRGDGSQCDTVAGTFKRPDGYGYVEAFEVPAGARNVIVEEEAASKNFIGVGSATGPVFYLNGRRKITLPGEYVVGGADAVYERDGERESLRVPGPLREAILVYVIFRGHARNPGVRYEYTVRRPGIATPSLSWRWADWSACSATCGGGRQHRRPVCAQTEGAPAGEAGVEDSECELTVGPRPADESRACASHACPAMWWPGPWQVCSATCGDAAARRRSVLCVAPEGLAEGGHGQAAQLALPDAECDPDVRPAEQERCSDVPPCAEPAAVVDSPGLASPPSSGRTGDNVDLFSVALSSRPSGESGILEVDGGEALDLNQLAEDERDYLANYTTFFESPPAQAATVVPSPTPAARPPEGGASHGQGVWEDDMDVPSQRLRPLPRQRERRRHGNATRPRPTRPRPTRPRGPAAGPGGRRRRRKPARAARGRNASSPAQADQSKDSFFLTFE